MLLFCLKTVLISNYYLRNNQIRIHYDQSKLYRTISEPKTSTYSNSNCLTMKLNGLTDFLHKYVNICHEALHDLGKAKL